MSSSYPIRSHIQQWDIPPPPGAEEYHQPTTIPTIPPTSSNVPPPQQHSGASNFNVPVGFYSGINYCTPNTYYTIENNSNHTHDRYNSSPPIRAPGTSGEGDNRYTTRRSPSPSFYTSSRSSRRRGASPPAHRRYSRERYVSRRSRSRHRSRSNSRYRRRSSSSSRRRRYRRSSRSRSNDRRSYHRRSRSRSSYYRKKHSPSRSSSSSASASSRSRSRSVRSTSTSSKEDTLLESTSRMSNTSTQSSTTVAPGSNVATSNVPPHHRGLDRQSHKEFIKSKAQEYAKNQQALHDKDPSNTFKNDGSFLEMFKKLQEKGKDDPTTSSSHLDDDDDDNKPPEKILNIVAAANTLLDRAPPTLPIVSKRRGGRVLKTGMVEKKRFVVQEEQPKDAWAVYMKEVKRYKEACCDDDSKTRPLVK